MTHKEKLEKIYSITTGTALALIIIGMGDDKSFDKLFLLFTKTLSEIKEVIRDD